MTAGRRRARWRSSEGDAMLIRFDHDFVWWLVIVESFSKLCAFRDRSVGRALL